MTRRISSCRSCGALIVWATVTPSGRTMPVDRDPHPDGTMRFTGEWPTPTVEVLAAADRAGAEALHRSHFTTCPNASQHRARKS